MLKKVKAFTRKYHMLEAEDCVITGVSGGADSICLVLMLLELQKEVPFRLVAVHVNHGLRGEEAKADENFVKRFCKEHGILCECYFADVELFAKKRKQSTEEAGRELRRQCFEEAMKKYAGTKIALAHHQNDNAETFFLNLARGTGLRGLGGILPVNGTVIRPLLCVNRQEIEDYLGKSGIEYCTDRTNCSDIYTRNRIRNHVLPYMEQFVNAQTVAHMNDTMEQLCKVQAYLDAQTEEAWKMCVCEMGDGLLVAEDKFRELPEVLQPFLLRRVLATLAKREKDLEAVHLEQLIELFEKQNGRKQDLPYGLVAKRIYEGLRISKKDIGQQEKWREHTFMISEKQASFQCGRYAIDCKVIKKEEINKKEKEKKHTKYFDCDIIKGNLCFRTRKAGDYITIDREGRTQKLKSFFINEKIPQEEREHILLVAEGSHVLWVVGYRRGFAYPVSDETTDMLEIQVDKGESYGREN